MDNFKDHVARAVLIKGSQRELAEAVGCSQQQISYLLNEADRISGEMALRISRATSGEVTLADLRPDLAPTPSEGQAA